MIVVVMGVSGSGKTTIGKLLAERMGWIFADADNYFSPASKQKMAEGHPLTDDDRAPWLQTLNTLLKRWDTGGINGLLACSALKAKYYEILEAGKEFGAVPWASVRATPCGWKASCRSTDTKSRIPSMYGRLVWSASANWKRAILSGTRHCVPRSCPESSAL